MSISSSKQSRRVEFDKETHTYTVDGVKVPAVSTVIRNAGLVDLSGINQAVLDRKADIGDQAHKACQYLDEERLGAVDDAVAPYLAAYEKFKKQSSFEPRLIEYQSAATVNGLTYGMTIDREGLIHGEPCLVDIKCAANIEPWVGVQLAGYDIGLKANYFEEGRKRVVLQLRKDGSYRIHTSVKMNGEHISFGAPIFDRIFLSSLYIEYFKRGSSLHSGGVW